MINLVVNNNVVSFPKNCSESLSFLSSFLVKYEEVKKVDFMNSTKNKKRFKIVKERRNLYTEDDDNYYFSRGILEFIPNEYYRVIDKSNKKSISSPLLTNDEIKKTLDSFDLREDQIMAVQKCLYAKRGVIQLPTAVGKSAIITSVIKRLQDYNKSMKFLVIAPTLSTVKNINDTIKSNGIRTEVFGHPSKSIVSPVTTSLVQTLINCEDTDVLSEIDAVFYDECLPGNSMIALPGGNCISLSEIFEDDSVNEVLSFDFDNCSYVCKRILRKFKTPYNKRFCKVYYEDIDGKLKGVTCTPNHKIYCKNKGFVEAQDLVEGDLLKIDYPFARNWKILEDKTYRKFVRVTFNVGRVSEYKYNLEVEDTHNYFANNVLVSNCHHLKCETWNHLNEMLPNVEYAFGFSARSIDRKEIFIHDFRDLSYESSLIVGSTGRVLMHMDPSYYIQKGIIALPVVMRVKNLIRLPEEFDESQWTKLVKLGLMSTDRTYKVSQVATMFSKYNRKVLILVSEREYAFTICKFLYSFGVTDFGMSFGAGCGYIFGGTNPPTPNKDISINFKSKDSMEVLDDLNNGNISILIATSHLDEGVDIKELDVCILACGGKKDRRIIQRTGRVLRKSKSGKYAYIVDFTDQGSSVLSRQSKSRLKMYKEDIGVPIDNIYDNIDISSIESKFIELEGLN